MSCGGDAVVAVGAKALDAGEFGEAARCAASSEHGDEVDLLLRNADAAMYCAKKAGRNAYRLFDGAMARPTGA